MNKKTILTVIFAVAALVAGVVVQLTMRDSESVAQQAKPLAFGFPDVSGRMHSINEWQGKVLVINFWATWCTPCLKEIPEFIKLQSQYQDRGLQFVGISIEDKQAVLDYQKTIEINYPMLIAGDAGIGLAQRLGNVINAVPFTLIVNQSGQVVHHQLGELSVDELLKIVSPLIVTK